MDAKAAFVSNRRRSADHNRKITRPSYVTKTHHGAPSVATKHAAPFTRRPAGAKRYVCAVITCADVDCDIPALLGLAQKDVLELRLAGPFVNVAAVALLDRTIRNTARR